MASSPPDVQQGAPETVLVVDDDAPMRRALSRSLSAAGFQTQVAESGFKALAILDQSPLPSAVILDFYMPGQPGDEVLRFIRAKYPDLIIIVLSGVATEADYAALLALGATECVPKADMENALLPVVQNLLRDRKLGRKQVPGVQVGSVREKTRHPVALPVSVKIETWDQYAVLYTGNISHGGIFIRMADPCPVGTSLRVRLGLPDGQVIELGGEVAHVVSPEQASLTGKRSGIGVRFVDWTEAERAQLADLVAKVRDRQQGAVPLPRADGLVTPSPRAPPAPVPSPAANSEDSLLSVLRGHLADLKEQDFFSVLGLSPETGGEAIRAAFLKLAKLWHPSHFALESSEVRGLVAECFIIIKRAYDTLSDPKKSVAYRTRLNQKTSPAEPTAPPAQAPASPAASAQPSETATAKKRKETPFSRDAELAKQFMVTGQYPLAQKALERAMMNNPLDQQLRATHALACAHQARQSGQIDQMAQWLELALAADSEYREAIDMLRELKEQRRTERQGFLKKLLTPKDLA